MPRHLLRARAEEQAVGASRLRLHCTISLLDGRYSMQLPTGKMLMAAAGHAHA